jgi:hypothetical protein
MCAGGNIARVRFPPLHEERCRGTLREQTSRLRPIQACDAKSRNVSTVPLRATCQHRPPSPREPRGGSSPLIRNSRITRAFARARRSSAGALVLPAGPGRQREAVIGKLPNLLRRRGADALVAVDRAACASGFALGGRVPPELPRRLRFDRCDEEEERRESHCVKEIPRGGTDPYNDEQEADERHRRLAKTQHDQSMRPLATEIHRRTGGSPIPPRLTPRFRLSRRG